MEYHVAAGWRNSPVRLIAGRGCDPLPWTDAYAKRVFNGEFPNTSGGFYQLVVLKGSLESPVAVASFQNAGHTVRVDFLDSEFRKELTYVFGNFRLGPDDMFLHDDGIQRPGELLIRDVIRTSWTGDIEGAGVERRETLVRQHSNLGTTRVGPLEIAPEGRVPENDWHVDSDVDVSGDGFWEPVATFGDWDRWFVKDRPGVKLFD